jgi:hypothetical protein
MPLAVTEVLRRLRERSRREGLKAKKWIEKSFKCTLP